MFKYQDYSIPNTRADYIKATEALAEAYTQYVKNDELEHAKEVSGIYVDFLNGSPEDFRPAIGEVWASAPQSIKELG